MPFINRFVNAVDIAEAKANFVVHLMTITMRSSNSFCDWTLCKKASNHHANLPLEMYSFTL